jgi:hypothetical protein
VLDFEYPTGLLDGLPSHWYAVVGTGAGRVVRDYQGMANAPVGSPVALLILEPGGGDQDAFVSRYDAQGRYVSDSWYRTREDALEDAAAGYAIGVGDWHSVPDETVDIEVFVFNNATY